LGRVPVARQTSRAESEGAEDLMQFAWPRLMHSQASRLLHCGGVACGSKGG
jgi:hypothetical protein